ncbi:lymphocyte antigen-6, epidermis [Ictalurus furcatus]|uniref:lymphocyte antigen-6, epidermis n=1 Tax=Ictalurus furcatus TaxID=66913 RepID=UPI002350704D|nr:lymphocyte antigen-6, epidermis [Ictalurus furcatus]
MKFVLLGIAVVIGFFALAESLTCNQCSESLLGICPNPSSVNCTTNTSVCTTSSVTSGSGLLSFNSQNCLESSLCNTTISTSILGVTYSVSQSCCNTDRCNRVNSGPSNVQLQLTAVLSATLLACVWGQSIY